MGTTGREAPATPRPKRPFMPRPVMFWSGVGLTCAGVGEHLWMFAAAAPMHFRMSMMPMDAVMWAAMAAITIGVLISGFALKPVGRAATAGNAAGAAPVGTPPGASAVSRRRVIGILSFALMVDQMKPATLAFIEPGMRAEYGLTAPQVAWLPTIALTGTVVGSLVWGRAADRIGRRATILTASLLFLGTTVCGAMPTFGGTLVMCFLMGVAAGGMLPVVYALMTETLPPGRRAVVMVLQAGLTTTGGYMAASGLAALLIPLAGWRVLWFAQLPLVLVLIGLNHWIPESAAYTADRGRPQPPPMSALLRRPYTGRTLIVSGYALAWGLVYWGFVTFLPTLLDGSGRHGGMSAATLLFLSSLLSIPTCVIAAWLYARWSARGTMVIYASVTVGALVAVAVVGPSGGRFATLASVVGLLIGTSGVIALLGPYTAEIYPTAVRGTAGGWAAAVSKSGGAFGPPLIAALLTESGLRTTALLAALPMAAAAVALAVRGSDPPAPGRTGEDVTGTTGNHRETASV